MLNGKQRAALRRQAHGIPALYQIGKDGITENVIKQFDDALEARELIKRLRHGSVRTRFRR